MVCIASWHIAIVLLAVAIQSQAQSNVNQDRNKASTESSGGIVAEEVVVESSLSVRPKPPVPQRRRVRNTLDYLFPSEHVALVRAKRQFNPQNYYPNPAFGSPVGFNPYGQSQATANAHSHTIDPFGNSNADAGAQAFNAGNFGATSNFAGSSSLANGPFGPSGGLSNAGGQTYTLPGGQTLNIGYNNANTFTPGSNANSRGSSVTYSG